MHFFGFSSKQIFYKISILAERLKTGWKKAFVDDFSACFNAIFEAGKVFLIAFPVSRK